MTQPQVKQSTFTFTENRGRPKAENPFIDAVKQSWTERPSDDEKHGVVMEVTIKDSKELNKNGLPISVVTAQNQIRDAATALGLGVRIQTVVTDAKGKAKVDGAYTTIYFAAKERTKRTHKQTS